eukprot:4420802-Pleurochrysis_carterae.AAC.1
MPLTPTPYAPSRPLSSFLHGSAAIQSRRQASAISLSTAGSGAPATGETHATARNTRDGALATKQK